jgi:hypothetical protein
LITEPSSPKNAPVTSIATDLSMAGIIQHHAADSSKGLVTSLSLSMMALGASYGAIALGLGFLVLGTIVTGLGYALRGLITPTASQRYGLQPVTA